MVVRLCHFNIITILFGGGVLGIIEKNTLRKPKIYLPLYDVQKDIKIRELLQKKIQRLAHSKILNYFQRPSKSKIRNNLQRLSQTKILKN